MGTKLVRSGAMVGIWKKLTRNDTMYQLIIRLPLFCPSQKFAGEKPEKKGILQEVFLLGEYYLP